MKHNSKNSLMEKFLEDSKYIYDNWKEVHIGDFNTKIFDRGLGPILFQTPIAKHLEPFWVPILKHFENRRRVITYERRESTTKYLHASDRAKDLKSVLDYMGIERCDFVSHSSGAIATLHLALMYPERVNSLVLMNVAAYYQRLQGPARILSDKIAQMLPDSIILPLFLFYLAERNTEEYEIHRYAFSQFKPLNRFMKYSLNHIVVTHDIRNNLHEIRCPVLLINRTDDRIVRMSDMEYMQERLPNCFGLKTVTGGGHMFHYTRSSQIIEFMDEFYEQIYGSTSPNSG